MSLIPKLFTIDSVFDSFFDDGSRLTPYYGGIASINKPLVGASSHALSCDVEETEREFVFHCDAAGMPKEAVSISIEDGQLRIKGERKDEREESSGKWHRIERSYGTYERCFRLPKSVDVDADVTATMTNGILRIHLPKLAPVPKKTVPVKNISIN